MTDTIHRDREELSGRRFGRLLVLNRGKKSSSGKYYWLCRCDCGIEKQIAGYALKRGQKSCNCLWKENNSGKTHGMYKTKEYMHWRGMHNRCSPNIVHPCKKDYADRGIKVCDRWSGKNGFLNFLSDVGNKPGDGYSIDRIDVNGNYEPRNVRWSTTREQVANRRKYVSIDQYSDQEFLAEAARRGLKIFQKKI
jgi:hypothetical protein